MLNRDRRIQVLAIAALLIIGLAATSYAQKKVTLEVWNFSPVQTAKNQRMMVLFKEKHPEVEFKLVEIPGAHYADKVLTAALTNTMPDLLAVEISTFGRFLKSSNIPFMDLTAKFEPVLDDFFLSRIAPRTYKGKVYGADIAVHPTFLYYRTDIFGDAGIREFETWDDFIEAGKKMKNQGRLMLSLPNDAWEQYWMLLNQSGGNIFDAEGNVILDSPEAIEALKLYKNMLDLGIATTGMDIFDPDGPAALKSGRLVCMIGADWTGAFLRDLVPDGLGKWGALPLPTIEPAGSRTSTWGGTAYMMARGTKHEDLAWEYLWFSNFTKEAILIEIETGNTFPAYKPAYEWPELTEDIPYFSKTNNYEGLTFGELVQLLAAEQNPFYVSPYWPEAVEAIARDVVFPVVDGKKTPEQALSEAAKAIRSLKK